MGSKAKGGSHGAGHGTLSAGSMLRDLLLLALGATSAVMAAKFKTALRGYRHRRRVVGVLPARYDYTGFPGKLLVPILGKPLVIRTYEQACKAKSLDTVVVATDNERIAEVCRQGGAPVVVTSRVCVNGRKRRGEAVSSPGPVPVLRAAWIVPAHPACRRGVVSGGGTEQCEEAVGKLGQRYDVVVSIPSDEPLIDPGTIDAVVRALQVSPDAVVSTACTPLARDEVPLRHRAKCVTDRQGYALYFSRGVIPNNKEGMVRSFPGPFHGKPYLMHLGLQCYDRAFLSTYCKMPATPLMLMEDLEQLKVLENGHRIKVVVVEHSAQGVDVPDDVASIEALMRQQGAQ